MMHWGIEFARHLPPSHEFTIDLFEFVISEGAEYDSGQYSMAGEYDFYDYRVDSNRKPTEIELGDITRKYQEFDPAKNSITVWLEMPGRSSFQFAVATIPFQETQTRVVIDTHTTFISDKTAFHAFVNLCRTTFEQFEFSHGQYRHENMGSLPFNPEDFGADPIQIVNFYSESVADLIGRDKLLSTPALSIDELINGGISLVICDDPYGCDRLYDARQHLSSVE